MTDIPERVLLYVEHEYRDSPAGRIRDDVKPYNPTGGSASRGLRTWMDGKGLTWEDGDGKRTWTWPKLRAALMAWREIEPAAALERDIHASRTRFQRQWDYSLENSRRIREDPTHPAYGDRWGLGSDDGMYRRYSALCDEFVAECGVALAQLRGAAELAP